MPGGSPPAGHRRRWWAYGSSCLRHRPTVPEHSAQGRGGACEKQVALRTPLPPPAFSRPPDGTSFFSVYHDETYRQPRLSPTANGGDMAGVITSGLPVRAASGSADARRVRDRRLSGLRRAGYLNDILEQDHAGSNAWPDRGGLPEPPYRPSHPRRLRVHGLDAQGAGLGRSRRRHGRPADLRGCPVRCRRLTLPARRSGSTTPEPFDRTGASMPARTAPSRPRWSPAGLVRHPWDRPGHGGRPGDGRDRAPDRRGEAARPPPAGTLPRGTINSCKLSLGRGGGRPPRMHVPVPSVPPPPALVPAAVRGAAA